MEFDTKLALTATIDLELGDRMKQTKNKKAINGEFKTITN